jgi:hypothetical protein
MRRLLTMSRTRDLLLLAGFTLILHAPFLTQPVQGDEVNYLDVAWTWPGIRIRR